MVFMHSKVLERQNVRDTFSWSHDNGTRLLHDYPGTRCTTVHDGVPYRNRGVFLDETHFFQLEIVSPVRLSFQKLQPFRMKKQHRRDVVVTDNMVATLVHIYYIYKKG